MEIRSKSSRCKHKLWSAQPMQAMATLQYTCAYLWLTSITLMLIMLTILFSSRYIFCIVIHLPLFILQLIAFFPAEEIPRIHFDIREWNKVNHVTFYNLYVEKNHRNWLKKTSSFDKMRQPDAFSFILVHTIFEIWRKQKSEKGDRCLSDPVK